MTPLEAIAAAFVRSAVGVSVCMSVLWVVSVSKRDASIVDPFWSIGFLLVASLSFGGVADGRVILWLCVALWAVRLSAHLLWRGRGKGEDPRYARFRQRFGPERYWWVSFFQVFVLQGALLLVIGAPIVVAMASPFPWSVGWVGVVIAMVGICCEAVADAQLARFRRSGGRGVLDTGLWRYSRHPNYFGDALTWWGFWIAALDAPYVGYTIGAPVLMTFLLLRVSGVTLLEAQLKETRPEYAAYIARTSAFVPWPPRRG